MGRLPHSLTVGALGAALAAGGLISASAQASSDTTWGPVVTLADQRSDGLQSVTTYNGLVVAVWNGPHFDSLRVAVHRPGQPWSSPTKIADEAAAFMLRRVGN